MLASLGALALVLFRKVVERQVGSDAVRELLAAHVVAVVTYGVADSAVKNVPNRIVLVQCDTA